MAAVLRALWAAMARVSFLVTRLGCYAKEMRAKNLAN